MRAPSAGWPPEEGTRVDTNLRLEVTSQAQAGHAGRRVSNGRDEQVVAASSPIWGEKYWDRAKSSKWLGVAKMNRIQ